MKRGLSTLIAVLSALALTCAGCTSNEADVERTVEVRVQATLTALSNTQQTSIPSDTSLRPTATAGQAIRSPMPEEAPPGVLWTLSVPNTGFASGFCVGDNRVFVMEEPGVVVAIDMATGEQLWQWEDIWETHGGILSCDSEAVYLVREDSRYYAVDARRGEQRWKSTVFPGGLTEATIRWSAADAERLYVALSALSGDVVAAVAKQDGSLVWELDDQEVIGRTEQTLLLLSRMHEFQGVESATGEARWKLSEGSLCGWGVLGTLVWEGTFFCHSVTGGSDSVMALDIDGGSPLWPAAAEGLVQIFQVSPAHVYGCGGTYCSPLRVFDRTTGRELWNRSAEVRSFLGEFENLVVVSDEATGFTWGIDSQTGDVRWENDDLYLNEVVGLSDNLLIGARGAVLYGIEFETGRLKWRVEQPGAPSLWLNLSTGEVEGGYVVVDGRILGMSEDQALVIRDSATGERISAIALPFRTAHQFLLTDHGVLIYGGQSLVVVRY